MGSVDTARGLEIGRCIFREASDCFFVFDPRDGRVVDVNPAALRMTGYDRPEILALRIEDLVTADADGLDRLLDALRHTQFFHSREGYALTRRDGTAVAVNVSVSRIHTRPEPLGLVVARDVSELLRAQAALEQFFQHSTALFAVLGPDGRVRTTNPAWQRTLGPIKAEPAGAGDARETSTGVVPWDLIHPEDRPLALEAFTRRSAGAPVVFEARFRRRDASWVWLAWSAGTIGGATYAVALDVTARRETEALQRAKQAAEAASAAKSQLLAHVSHELRTPLSAMLGLVDVLLADTAADGGGSAGAEPGAMTPDLRAIRRNGTHLARLIDDLLDLARADAGRLEIKPAPCRPSEVVTALLDLLGPAAAEKGLRLTAEVSPSAPESICTDALRLQQILLNLVGNAIKYTERGSVVIRCEPAQPEPGSSRPMIRFDIIDTGKGLSPEALAGLFEPFHRGGDGPCGAGLGLAISRRLAELLEGSIEVRSAPGRGATFSLRIATDLPAAEASLPAPVPPAGAAGPARPRLPCRVLLAEDHADNRRAVSLRLGMIGLDVTAVGDGSEAARRALEAQAEGQPFDVILMDMHMPVTDGFEATVQLRAAGYRGAIIALTADARSEDRSECLQRGCNDHLAKPIDWDRLLSLIATHTAPAARVADRAGSAGAIL
jgi:PAS domain S-box-containing protein